MPTDVTTPRPSENGAGVQMAAQGIRQVEKATAPITVEVGQTGLNRWGGTINEEFLPALRGKQGRAALREMSDNDAIVGGMLTAIDLLIRQVTWTVSPKDDTPLAQEIADFCWGALNDLEDSWADTLSQILSMLPFGFSYHEIVYKHRNGEQLNPLGPATSKYADGKIGWRGFPIRAQDSLEEWVYEKDANGVDVLTGFAQMSAPDYQRRIIPLEKSLHFRTTAIKANPEGRSILRSAWPAFYKKRRVEEFEGIGIERDLAGIAKVTAPAELFSPHASVEQKQMLVALTEMVKTIRQNTMQGIVMPSEKDEKGNDKYTFELVVSGGKKQIDTNVVIGRLNQDILISALADVLLIGHQSGGLGGETSAATVKTELFQAAIQTYCEQIAGEFSTNAFPRLARFNGWPADLAPTLEPGKVATIDLDELLGNVLKMSQSGFQVGTDRVLEDHLREALELPLTSDAGGAM